MGTLRFDDPWVLLALVAVVPVASWLLFVRERARTPRFVVSRVAAFDGAPVSLAARLRWLPRALRVGALALAIVALARPQGAADQGDVMAGGIDIAIALDISGSMSAADFKPVDRMTVARQVIGDFILSRQSDRIGLVVFAREAFTQCPLTLDYSVLHNLLDQIEAVTDRAMDGTAIGNAIATAINRLVDSEAKSRIVILVTDGDSNAGNVSPNQAAEIARTEGIPVFTILVGKGGEVPMPQRDAFGRTHYVMANMPVNPALLEEISGTTGGKSYLATDEKSLEESFRKVIDEMERTLLHGAGGYKNYTELLGWFLVPAIFALCAEVALAATRLRRFP